eukprot:s612_g32.t1
MRTPVKLVPRAEVEGLRGRSRSRNRHEVIFPLQVQILNALTGESSFSIAAQSSWSIANLKSEIARLRQVPVVSGSEMQLLMETKILKDNELLKNLCATGELELRMLEVPEDFYVRYFAKMVIGGGRDHEFQEFEFCSNGRFRFARNFLQGGFFEGKQLRKECFLSQASLRVLKGLVLKSGILQMDDSQWPAPTRETRQEIEIKCQGTHVVFATKLHWSLPHVDAGRKCAHMSEMSEFDELAEELKGFGKSQRTSSLWLSDRNVRCGAQKKPHAVRFVSILRVVQHLTAVSNGGHKKGRNG